MAFTWKHPMVLPIIVSVKKEILMKSVKKYRWVSLTLAACISFAFASAASAASVTAVPTAWKLQSYGTTGPVLWYTGSSCDTGQIVMDPSWSADQAKLLWATVMTAKASLLPVTIDYTVNSLGQCVITDFALAQQ
jgi:hypothetical protein